MADGPGADSGDGLEARAHAVALAAWSRAAALDASGGFPDEEVAHLKRAGLLVAPLPAALGGTGLGVAAGSDGALGPVLRRLGGASLPLGRLYEGHVNAVKLTAAYGSPPAVEAMGRAVRAGALAGVWTVDAPDAPVRLVGEGSQLRLAGAKVLASGAGRVRSPLFTARDDAGALRLVRLDLSAQEAEERADLSRWTATGMKASRSGRFDLEGLAVPADALVGGADDYLRQPLFSGGAWRVLAVHLGAMERVLELWRAQLRGAGRDGDPVQRARFGAGAAAVETSRLWVARAGAAAEAADGHPDTIAAYVDLARRAVGDAALALLADVQRAVGLSAFLHPHPLERVMRDLQTYLRQPFPDAALDAAAARLFAREDGPHADWTRP